MRLDAEDVGLPVAVAHQPVIHLLPQSFIRDYGAGRVKPRDVKRLGGAYERGRAGAERRHGHGGHVFLPGKHQVAVDIVAYNINPVLLA